MWQKKPEEMEEAERERGRDRERNRERGRGRGSERERERRRHEREREDVTREMRVQDVLSTLETPYVVNYTLPSERNKPVSPCNTAFMKEKGNTLYDGLLDKFCTY